MSDAFSLTRPDTLARNRRLATGVLIAMTAVYLATHVVGHPAAAVLLIRAMAEAGMIGGLADWFAVTALFRHPLGIPIPHTALLPKNQALAARNVGRFFETHFLAPAQVEMRVRAIEPSRQIAAWIGQRPNARMLSLQLADLAAAFLRHEPPARAIVRGRAWLRRQAVGLGSDAAIAGTVAGLVKVGMRGGVGDVLGLVRQAIDENRDVAVTLVQENSRWWIASPVDRRVADAAVNAILSLVDDLRREDSPLRRQFEGALEGMVGDLERNGALARAVKEARRHMVDSGALDEAAGAMLSEIRQRFLAHVAAEPSVLTEPLAELIRETTTRLLSAREARAALDDRLAELAGRIVGEARPQVAAYVADVIASWKPEELNARFEEEIGPDLQFIRINGAVLGCLIGGALFGFEALLG